MNKWMPVNPCPDCCRKASDPDKSLCRLYAYDLDCVYLANYKGATEYQKKLLEYLIADSKKYPEIKAIGIVMLKNMLKELEASNG